MTSSISWLRVSAGDGRHACWTSVVAQVISRFPLHASWERFVAVDVEPEMLREGESRVRAAGVRNVRFQHGRAEEVTDIVGGVFDAVTIGWAFHWFTDHDGLLQRLDAVVHPTNGAVVIIGDPTQVASEDRSSPRREAPADPGAVIDRMLGHYLGGTPEPVRPPPPLASYRELLARSAFPRVEEVTSTYERVELLTIDAAIGFRYSLPGSLERLGDRRATFEEDVRRALGAFEPSRRVVSHVDRALVGRRDQSRQLIESESLG